MHSAAELVIKEDERGLAHGRQQTVTYLSVMGHMRSDVREKRRKKGKPIE